MLTVNNKKYKYIFWDWLNTLYDPFTDSLYPWVLPFFDRYGNKADHFLITFVVHPERRMSMIQRLDMMNKFKEIRLIQNSKDETFIELIQNSNLDPKSILVVGDSLDSEIRSAETIGVDALLVKDFVKLLKPA